MDKAYYNRYKNIVEGVNTYWLSQPVKNAFSHAHSLFVEGGADNVRYGIDASYNQNKGVMKESGRDRFGLGFSLIYRIKDKTPLKIIFLMPIPMRIILLMGVSRNMPN